MNRMKPWLDPVLRRFGIDARRYWLLMGLFHELADRREVFNQLGRDGVTLKSAMWLYFIFSGLMSAVFVGTHPSPSWFFWAVQLFSGIVLTPILFSETGNSLVNPVEAGVMAHEPIDGATYTAAKLSHLLRILFFLVPGLNGPPAILGLFVAGSSWLYPLVHMAGAFLVGLVSALLCCSVYGWLIRFVPASRLKSVGQIAEAVPWLAVTTLQLTGSRLRLPRWHFASGYLVAAGALAGCVALAAVVFGIRSLSSDYLVRVSAIAHGGSSAKARVKPTLLSGLVARIGGGPPTRAAYEFVSRLLFRDWQFRRAMIPMLPAMISSIVLVVRGWNTDPFSGSFTLMHVLPHCFGFMLFVMCTALVYGSHPQGSWVFLLMRAGAFPALARGVYWCLWVRMIAVPHALLLPFLAIAWGWMDAALFVTYSLAAASAYLGLELRLIEGVPFTRQAETSRNPYMMMLMLLGGLAIALIVGLQYFLIFRSRGVVLVTTAAIAVGFYFVTRSSLDSFAGTMRYNLGMVSGESKGLYLEIEA